VPCHCSNSFRRASYLMTAPQRLYVLTHDHCRLCPVAGARGHRKWRYEGRMKAPSLDVACRMPSDGRTSRRRMRTPSPHSRMTAWQTPMPLIRRGCPPAPTPSQQETLPAAEALLTCTVPLR
jgi:hypothetical protein